jgi:hypothetical protein
LGKEIEIIKAALPAIAFKNRNDIRWSDLPILWIPWIKDFLNRIHADSKW